MTLTCTVHYSNQVTYSKLKVLSDTNMEKIEKSKRLRELLGGENNHQDQCVNVPEVFDDAVHGIHLEPCYKK